MNFQVHSIATAPEGAKQTLAHVQKTLGIIPNLAATMAESPSLVEAFFAIRDVQHHGTLSPLDVQVLSLTNACENRCSYCMALHSAFALKEGLSPESLAALRDGRAPREPRLAALSDFSRALVRNRGQVSAPDLAAFQAAGYTRAQALEVVLGVGVSILANFSHHLTAAPVDAPFEAHAWTSPRGDH